MKTVDEVKRYIEELYHKIPGKNYKDIEQIKTTDNMEYKVYKRDGSTADIPRRLIDLWIDSKDENSKKKIIDILKNL
jgi:hypothetical protein